MITQNNLNVAEVNSSNVKKSKNNENLDTLQQNDINAKIVENNIISINNNEQKKVKKNEKQKSNKNEISETSVPNWNVILDKLKQNGKIMLYTNLLNSKAIELNDMTIGIELNNGITTFGKKIIETPENLKELELAVSTELGKTMHIKIIENERKTNGTTKSLGEDIGLPINVIE